MKNRLSNSRCRITGHWNPWGSFLKSSGAAIGLLLMLGFFLEPGLAQQSLKLQPDYGKNPEWFPRIYKPYQMQKIPELRLTNSPDLGQLIENGKLRISLSQLKTAVGENNLDVLSSNNSALFAQTDLLRVKGGGAPRGGGGVQIPSGLFAGAIGAGVQGYGGLGGFGSVGGITGGASQVRAFPSGSYDPSLAIGFSIDKTNSPLNSLVVSGLPEVTTTSIALQTRYAQSFTTGSSISVSFNNMTQRSTQKYLLYNPYFVSRLSIVFTQQLLSGFGFDSGRRFLEVAKNEQKIVRENVRLQLSRSLASAQNDYWDLVTAHENLLVAQQSLELATRFLEDEQKKEEVGASSGMDVVSAESELAARQRDLVGAKTAVQMQEVDLKNAISMDIAPLLNSVQIEPSDRLPEPKEDDIPRMESALKVALTRRPEILKAEADILNQEVAVRYAKDLLKPSLMFFAMFNSSGLYGDQIQEVPPAVLRGGLSQAMRQVWRWDYPEYAVGVSFSLNVRNRAAQADSYRAKREKQQSEMALQQLRNSIALEVRESLIGLTQAKAELEAAHKAVELSSAALAAEETRLNEGVSIPYEVMQRQRDLRSAQFAEVQARSNYAKALVERDRSMGVLAPSPTN